jgi:Zn-dependent metalloprotease
MRDLSDQPRRGPDHPFRLLLVLGLVLAAAPWIATPAGADSDAEPARRQLSGARARGGTRVNPDQLREVGTIRSKTGTLVRFQQEVDGVPVYGALISVHVTRGRRAATVRGQFEPEADKVARTPLVDRAEAVRRARAHVGVQGKLRGPLESRLVIYPIGDALRLAWQVDIPAREPLGDWRIFVDAQSGAILDELNRIIWNNPSAVAGAPSSGSGKVFNPNPVASSGNTALTDQNNADVPELNNARVSVTLERLDGSGFLKGQFADLTATGIEGGYKEAGQASSESGDFEYTRGNDAFEEVMSYSFVDQAQMYLRDSLGYTDVVNRSIPIHAHYFDETNAFYSPANGGLHFGDRGVDAAEDAEVIVHEYGHAVLDDILPSAINNREGRALHEGFADYFATTRLVDANAAAQKLCLGEWIAVSLGASCIRRLDETKQYPRDLEGEEHADGEIWAAMLWQIREALGRATADRIVLEALFLTDPLASLPLASDALLDADQALNGGANQAMLLSIIEARGFGPCDPPEPTTTVTRQKRKKRTLEFSATDGLDEHCGRLSRLWDFGDGEVSSRNPIVHRFDKSGEYTVTYTVKDARGQAATATETVKIKKKKQGREPGE